MSNILRGELVQVAPDMLNFQMLRKFKSHKITSDKRVVLKPSRFVVGTHNVLVWKEFMQHLPLFSEEEISEEKKRVRLVELYKSLKAKKNQNKLIPLCDRLFLRPLNNVQPNDAVWFSKTPVREHFATEIVKNYIPALLVQSPHFAGCEELKLTNPSIHKSHAIMH